MCEENGLTENIIVFKYKFSFKNRKEKIITIKLNALTLDHIPSEKKNSCPSWTKLSFYQCENCPLDVNIHEYCPIAVNFIDLFDYFTPTETNSHRNE